MLYFQARAQTDFLNDLIEMATSEKSLSRPKELGGSFSLSFLNFKTELKEKLPAELEQVKQRATEWAPIAVLTSVEMFFNNWKLTFTMPATDALWHVQPASTQ